MTNVAQVNIKKQCTHTVDVDVAVAVAAAAWTGPMLPK